MLRPFRQVDVFTSVPYRGNPVAVVMEGDGLSGDEMQRYANWTNLSETTFLLTPTNPEADYRVRIFTPDVELPFAGHPTIGTCHAWLEAGGVPQGAGSIIQECGIGLVTLRQSEGRLGFAAPPLIRSGPVDEADRAMVIAVLGVDQSDIVDMVWADNGPGWIAVQLRDAAAVLDLDPDFTAADHYDLGVVGLYSHAGLGDPAIEVRALFRAGGGATEDPVTGSLNAGLAQWLLGSGTLTAPYVASQGTALARAGRVHVSEADDEIWVGGDAVTCIKGTVEI